MLWLLRLEVFLLMQRSGPSVPFQRGICQGGKKSFDLQKIQAEVAPSYKHFSNCMFLAIVVPALPSPASSVGAVVNLASNSTNDSQ